VDDEIHLKVLRLLQDSPQLNQREMAEALGVSLGKTNYCLKALMDKGYVKMQNFMSSHNKLAYSYLLTPSGISEKAHLTTQFLKRKVAEYESLKNEIESLKSEVYANRESLI
jgi:EPS-associated MarR family transcriptional regulator